MYLLAHFMLQWCFKLHLYPAPFAVAFDGFIFHFAKTAFESFKIRKLKTASLLHILNSRFVMLGLKFSYYSCHNSKRLLLWENKNYQQNQRDIKWYVSYTWFERVLPHLLCVPSMVRKPLLNPRNFKVW